MKVELDKIMTEAMELPAPMRAFLASKLIESLDANGAPELSDEWKQEIRRRCREIDEGTVRLVSAQEAFSKAYARLTHESQALEIGVTNLILPPMSISKA